VVEGAPLLREYAVKSCIEGSNPSLSARNKKARASGPSRLWRREAKSLRTSREGFEGIGDAPQEPPIRGRQNVGESLSLPTNAPAQRARSYVDHRR
jgi:hypothetical protein